MLAAIAIAIAIRLEFGAGESLITALSSGTNQFSGANEKIPAESNQPIYIQKYNDQCCQIQLNGPLPIIIIIITIILLYYYVNN